MKALGRSKVWKRLASERRTFYYSRIRPNFLHMQGDFITIATYPYPHDPELTALQARLTEAGLHFYVMDNNFLSVIPFDTQAIGGVKVRVHEEQLGRAQRVLEKLKAERPLPIEPLDEEDAAWMQERQEEAIKQEREGRRVLRVLGVGGGLLGLGALLRWLVVLMG